jgi:tetratricopeptide (TPR) repeat protein
MSLPSYLAQVSELPSETYIERQIDNLSNAIAEHPEDKVLLKQQLLLWMQATKKIDETIQLAYDLINEDTEKRYTDDAYLILARSFVHKNDTEKAIAYYKDIIALDPTIEEAILELARIYEKKFDYDSALSVYDYLDNDDIDDGKESMYCHKAATYFNKKDSKKALEYYFKALELSPEDEDGWFGESIGATYWQMNNFEEASKWFKQVLEKHPDSVYAHYGMGLCYQNADDSYRALHHYYEGLKIDPTDTNTLNNIAAITINDEGNIKEGISILEKALESTTDEKLLGQIYLNLSRVYSRICDYDRHEYYKAKFFKSVGLDDLFTLEEDDDDDDDDGVPK